MPNYDIKSATTTDYAGSVADVTVSAVTPDSQGTQKKIIWDFPDAARHNGYYQSIPELKSALHVFAQRVCGLGYDVLVGNKLELDHVRGSGKETFTSIIMQALIESKVFGDSFTELVYADKENPVKLINMKRLYTGDMVVIYNEQGLIEGYEQKSNNPKAENIKFKPFQILHLTNDKLGNELHGTSVIRALKKIIDAKNQAFEDEIMIRHRDKALGIVYYDTDDAGKISYANSQIQDAVNKGEMVGLPKDTALIEEFPSKAPADRIQYMQYLDNLFYQVVGTPKVLVTSEGFTEAGGKAGLLSFEPVEISEKLKLEENIWNQMAKKLKFKRASSLLGNEQETQSKNAGQTGIQDNETSVSPTRTE